MNTWTSAAAQDLLKQINKSNNVTLEIGAEPLECSVEVSSHQYDENENPETPLILKTKMSNRFSDTSKPPKAQKIQ
jgi:hypothetical protein